MTNKSMTVIEDWKVVFDPARHWYYLSGRSATGAEIKTDYIREVDKFMVRTDCGEVFILGEPDPEYENYLKTINPLWTPEYPLAWFSFDRRLTFPAEGQARKNEFVDAEFQQKLLAILKKTTRETP